MRISKEAAVDNKARVLEVAKRLLREKGFSALGVAEVMKEAGFTHGGFYNHFGSKENLAVEAVQSAFDEAVYDFDHDLNPDYSYDALANDPPSLKRKVIRGGSWIRVARDVRAAYRDHDGPSLRNSDLGFRCAEFRAGLRA